MRDGRRSALKPALAVAAVALIGLIAMVTVMIGMLARRAPASRPRPATSRAAAHGSFLAVTVRALVVTGDNLVTGKEPFSALDLAARNGRVGAIAALLDAGAAVDELDGGPNGWTPLMHAVHKGQESAVDLLLARGADPNAVAAVGHTALDLAAGQGELAIVRRLLAAGATPTPRALTNAVAGGHTEVVRALLERSPRLRLKPGFLARLSLLLARLRGDRETLTLLAQAARRP
ncbi:MAG TPA: ankyrin repeat domain-containing protein [Thermoanaerobaculia bacterium]|nr:ankyrin repeat domain-containing protein [Thermoanaerobaculia bacterium]